MPQVMCMLVLGAAPAIQAEPRAVCRLPDDLSVGTRHAWIRPLASSPADGSPAHWAADRWLENADGGGRQEDADGGEWHVVVGDTKSTSFARAACPNWSPDGESGWIGGRRGRHSLWAPMPLA